MQSKENEIRTNGIHLSATKNHHNFPKNKVRLAMRQWRRLRRAKRAQQHTRAHWQPKTESNEISSRDCWQRKVRKWDKAEAVPVPGPGKRNYFDFCEFEMNKVRIQRTRSECVSECIRDGKLIAKLILAKWLNTTIPANKSRCIQMNAQTPHQPNTSMRLTLHSDAMKLPF